MQKFRSFSVLARSSEGFFDGHPKQKITGSLSLKDDLHGNDAALSELFFTIPSSFLFLLHNFQLALAGFVCTYAFSLPGIGMEFDDTIGALLIGQIVSTFLYGLGTLQTYIYYAKYPKDGRELKVWVGAIWMIDTVNVALVCHGLYFVIYGKVVRDQEKADMGIRTFDISSGFNVLVAILVQCFFVKRIYQLCQVRMRHFLSLFLTALVLAHFALGSTAVVKVINALNSSSSLASLAFSAGLPYTLAAVLSDTSISITLIILLSSRRSEFESINSIINRAINFSLSRCLLVSIVAIGRLVTFTVSPKTAWFLAMDFAMGKLYANSLLAMLNSRRSPSIFASESDTQTADTNPVFTTVMDMPSSEPTTSSAFTSSTPQRTVDLERSQGTVKNSTHTSEHYINTLSLAE